MDLLIALLLGAAMLLVSVHRGPDASWDFRNYHLYDGFAALEKAPGTDLIPAQRQTFHAPTLDIPVYWLHARLNQAPALLDALLALPSALAVGFAWFIGRTLRPGGRPLSRPGLLLAILFGATGAAGWPTTGTSMSEMPDGCLALLGLLFLMRPQARWAPVAAAGLLMGAAAGLKLTAAPALPAGAAALLLAGDGSPRRRMRDLILFGASGVLGALASGGWWWFRTWSAFGDPFFPYLNTIFHAPLIGRVDFSDPRALPRGLREHLFYPFTWSLWSSTRASELPLRDPRLALAWLGAMAILVAALCRRATIGRSGGRLLVFCAVFVLFWELQFGVLRYLAPVELLSGLVLLLALTPLRRACRWLPELALAALLAGTAAITLYPDWGRPPPGLVASAVKLPPLGPQDMVLVSGDAPLAYLATFADPRTRFIGIDNNMTRLIPGSPFMRRLTDIVDNHAGPLWVLEIPGQAGDPGTVARFHLRRAGACLPVETNLEADGVRLCPLAREGSS